jgi:hypothetical protein
MNDCRKFQTMMADALAGELPEGDSVRLRAHMKNCERCSAEYREYEALVRTVRERPRPEPDAEFWDGYMARLDEKLDVLEGVNSVGTVPKGKTKGSLVVLKRLLIPLAAAALLVMGILIGRAGRLVPQGPLPSETPVATTSLAANQDRSETRILQAHLSSVEPLLMELSNRSDVPGDRLTVDAAWVRELLLQNTMLKRMVDRQNDKTRKALLDDLEMILLEMKSEEGGAGDSAQPMAQQVMEDNGVLFRVRMMRRRGGTV